MTENKNGELGKSILIASLATSISLVSLFAALSIAVNSSRGVEVYSQVDIIAGMVFVFILSMIVGASVWPVIIEKKIKQE